ncbi:protein of unknown function [Ralstonia solanacearum CMR15]|nr:protein of unknown function [Ralstonia solanacearum CMR15]
MGCADASFFRQDQCCCICRQSAALDVSVKAWLWDSHLVGRFVDRSVMQSFVYQFSVFHTNPQLVKLPRAE